MAYNIFRRPMFKRGGSAKGQGIMSHVEPRVQAANGFPTFGLSGRPSQAQIDAFRQAEADRINRLRQQNQVFAQPRSIPYIPGAGFSFLGSGITQDTRPMTPPAGIGSGETTGGGILSTLFGRKVTPPSVDVSGVSNFGFSSLKPGIRQIDTSQTTTGGSMTPPFGIGPEFEVAKKTVNEEEIDKNLKDSGAGKPATKEGSYEESDTRATIEKEADLLKELLGPAISKGEKALLIAKAVGTPGSIGDKLAVARDEGMKLAAGKRKQDRAAILTAYKYAKEKELKEIAAGKKSTAEQLYDEYARLAIKKDKTPLEQKKFEALEGRIGSNNIKSFATARLAELSKKDRLIDARDDIREYEEKVKRGETPSKRDTENYKEAQRLLDLAKSYAESAGIPSNLYAKGGRVKLAEGTEIEDVKEEKMYTVEDPMKNNELENFETSVDVEADQAVPMKPVQKLSYQDLRTRLPKEITNDIVQLIANSEEALQDFAYIKTQEDINDFNKKYGVNLVLPPQTI